MTTAWRDHGQSNMSELRAWRVGDWYRAMTLPPGASTGVPRQLQVTITILPASEVAARASWCAEETKDTSGTKELSSTRREREARDTGEAGKAGATTRSTRSARRTDETGVSQDAEEPSLSHDDSRLLESCILHLGLYLADRFRATVDVEAPDILCLKEVTLTARTDHAAAVMQHVGALLAIPEPDAAAEAAARSSRVRAIEKMRLSTAATWRALASRGGKNEGGFALRVTWSWVGTLPRRGVKAAGSGAAMRACELKPLPRYLQGMQRQWQAPLCDLVVGSRLPCNQGEQ